MKLEGLHGQETAKRGTRNLAGVSRKKSCGNLCSRVSVRRATRELEYPPRCASRSEAATS